MNIAIDVIAAFNTIGEIKPLYVRLEDENHKLIDHKLSVLYSKAERYSGIETIAFKCTYTDYDLTVKEITIKYHIAAHKWVMVT
jgi:hypothetical protein